MKAMVVTLMFLTLNIFNSMSQNSDDGYTLKKAELLKLLNDESKKRCKSLENELGLEEGVEIYTFNMEKYLVYFSDENEGVLYDSKEELIEVATSSAEELVYEDWIRDINLKVDDIIFENEKKYSLLCAEIGRKNLTVSDFKEVEKFMLSGGFMNYDAELYKEMLIYTLDVMVKNRENVKVLLEPNQNGDLEIFIESGNKVSNLSMFVWNSVFEPFEGYFSVVY